MRSDFLGKLGGSTVCMLEGGKSNVLFAVNEFSPKKLKAVRSQMVKSGNVFDDVQLQFLLGGANVAATRWSKGKMYTGDGSGTRRTRLDYQRVATLSCMAILKGHKGNLTEPKNLLVSF
jgi:hypothetical protein